MFILVSIILPIIIFIAPVNVKAIQGNLDLSSAQTSVGKRFAKVFCDAKREGLDSDFASEYACLLYTSPSPRDTALSRMPSSA